MNEKTAVNALTALAHEARLRIFRTLVGAGPEGLTPSVLSAMLDLCVPEARWSVHVKNEVVIHPLAGKLRATLHAYSVFVAQRGNDEERGGEADENSALVTKEDPNRHRPPRPPPRIHYPSARIARTSRSSGS